MKYVAEIWKPVTIHDGYDGYEVSNFGRVRCWNPRNKNANAPETPRVLKPNTSATGGYKWLVLYGQGAPKKVRVHTLVMHEFIGPAEGRHILHLDDDPTNNRLDNLRYGTPKENALDRSINGKSQHVLRYLDEFAKYCNVVATSKGFWDDEPGPDVYLAKMALIHSEISEILEAYRKEQGSQKLTEEFADVAIRLFDLWSVMHDHGLVGSFREAILDKTLTNVNRKRKHGNLI